MFDHAEFDGHEELCFAHDEASGLRAIVAIHSTALGPAFGGCRMWPYRDPAQALTDVLRLSRGMTYKAAICGLPYGGGKSVIIGDPQRLKTPPLLRAMGALVDRFAGRYIIADDVGTTLADLAVMRETTRHTAAATATAQLPLDVTAHGVFNALLAVAKDQFNQSDFRGLTVAVQGLGKVGYPLCASLHRHGARLVVADVDRARVEAATAAFAAEPVAVEAIYDAAVDIFAPCALGAALDDATIPRLRARVVCGGANNQLARREHDRHLADRGIVFVPDFLVSAGGVIDFHQESVDDRPEAVMRAVERIGAITAEVLRHSRASGRTPCEVAEALVRDRLARSNRLR